MWLVRHLDVHVTVGSSWPFDRTSLAVTHAVTAAVRRTVTDVDDRVNVLWFPDQASFLARFFNDVAEDRMTDRWEYRHLLDERQSRSETVASQFVRSSSAALDALRQMSPDQRLAVVNILSPDDARTVLVALASTAGDGHPKGFEALVDAMAELSALSRLPAQSNVTALAIFVSAVCLRGAPPSPWTASRATEAAAIIDVLRNARTGERDGLADAIITGAWDAISRDQLSALAGLATWPDDARRAAVATALPESDSSGASLPREGDVSTRLGGMFLLLPIIDEFPLDIISTWPDLNGIPPRRVIRFLALVSALGAPRNAAAAADAVLRWVVDIPSQLTSNEISGWINDRTTKELDTVLAGVGSFLRSHDVQQEFISPSALDEQYAAVGPPFGMTNHATHVVGKAGAAVARVLAGRLPGLAKSSLSYIWTNILDFDARITTGEEQHIVTVSDPPLHLLLSMTGLNQRRFVLEGQKGHEWVLTRTA